VCWRPRSSGDEYQSRRTHLVASKGRALEKHRSGILPLHLLAYNFDKQSSSALKNDNLATIVGND
jgi:hypothetical protein